MPHSCVGCIHLHPNPTDPNWLPECHRYPAVTHHAVKVEHTGYSNPPYNWWSDIITAFPPAIARCGEFNSATNQHED